MWNGVFRSLQLSVATALLASAALADDVLRFQKDAAREREWRLTKRGVVVVAQGTRTFVRLPGWVMVGEAFACAPALALGPRGEALVSSNVIPSLWRIDPQTLHVTRHELVADAHGGKDVGFTGMVYAAEPGVYFAVSPFGALWRIDPLLRRAQHVALDGAIRPACGLSGVARRRSARLFALCVHGSGGSWRIDLAPDLRSGQVRPDCEA